MATGRFQSFAEFYPFYLGEHTKTGTRVSHFVGTTLFFAFLAATFWTGNLWYIPATILTPYFFAWIGHFFIEKNKPATFQYPLWSLMGDFKLYFQILAGREKLKGTA